MSGTRTRSALAKVTAALFAALALTLGAAFESPAAPAAPAADPTPAGSGAQQRFVSPFTGLNARQGPVLAVKFDNHSMARPHTGLDQADIVYVEKVEGGLSRIMGVYSSRYPRTLGPVRSGRESDLELLPTFGRPVLAYSGTHPGINRLFRKAPFPTRSHGKLPGAYFRSGSRVPPHNLFVHPRAVLRSAPTTSKAADIGFRFGPAPRGGKPTARRTVRYGAATHSFTWSPRRGRWLVSMDGSPARATNGARLGGRTVVIQYAKMWPTRFRDSNGVPEPYIKTIGTGHATVLRDGKAYATRWSRPTRNSPTAFTLRNGKRMPFAPGQVWVVYQKQ
ncbi:DUF3048 domain-containing protein [Streptomyces sp. NPDC059009]|uniref:DUF3048 domain-containing protein n=1 Tax=Streptomyces sp. NPDC059009 TaxID=3346694 RepID=UPI0036B07E19